MTVGFHRLMPIPRFDAEAYDGTKSAFADSGEEIGARSRERVGREARAGSAECRPRLKPFSFGGSQPGTHRA